MPCVIIVNMADGSWIILFMQRVRSFCMFFVVGISEVVIGDQVLERKKKCAPNTVEKHPPAASQIVRFIDVTYFWTCPEEVAMEDMISFTLPTRS